MPHSPDELRGLADEYLDGLELWPQLHGQAESVRYSITVGGKRVRPVICLAELLPRGRPAAPLVVVVERGQVVVDERERGHELERGRRGR